MTYDPLPRTAAWRHLDARDGFEVLHVDHHENGLSLRGHTTAVEEDVAWSVGYLIEVDPAGAHGGPSSRARAPTATARQRWNA